MSVRIGLVLDSEENKKWNTKIINAFEYNGNHYTKINIHPYVTLDISPSYGKDEEWSRNYNINLTKNGMFRFLRQLKGLIGMYKTEKNLYYYDSNNNLIMNKSIAHDIESTSVINNKIIIMRPTVVTDKVDNQQYEGMLLIINSIDNFCEFTYEEMEYLYYVLSQINYDQLGLALLSLSRDIKERGDVIEIAPNSRPMIETREIIQEKPIPNRRSPGVIPDLDTE